MRNNEIVVFKPYKRYLFRKSDIHSKNELGNKDSQFDEAKITHKMDQVKLKIGQRRQNPLKNLFKKKSIFNLESSVAGSLKDEINSVRQE